MEYMVTAQWEASVTLPFSPRRLWIGSLSSSGTCLLPMKRTCCLEARYEGCGQRGTEPATPRAQGSLAGLGEAPSSVACFPGG